MRKHLMILLTLCLFLIPALVVAQTACEDYCSDSIYYYRGTYNERTGQCDYSYRTDCEYGCNREGTACASVSGECVDSDGRDIYTKGITTGWNYDKTKIITSSDYCTEYSGGPEVTSGKWVAEEQCDEEKRAHAYYYECPENYWCSDGRCVYRPTTKCPDYCSNSIYYYRGTYNERTGQCDYSYRTDCEYGCNREGTACASAPEREARADLAVKSLSTNTLKYRTGEPTTFRAEIENAGNLSTTGVVYAMWYIDDNPYKEIELEPMEAGKTKILFMEWEPKKAGNHTIKLVLDSKLSLIEISRYNNIRAYDIQAVSVIHDIMAMDSDDDGVNNFDDLCSGTESDMEVDENGCPSCKIDTDGNNPFVKGDLGYFEWGMSMPPMPGKGSPPTPLSYTLFVEDKCAPDGKTLFEYYCEVNGDECTEVTDITPYIAMGSLPSWEGDKLFEYHCVLSPSTAIPGGSVAVESYQCICGCKDGACLDEADSDGDGLPDCVDEDMDGDGLSNMQDNCPNKYNPSQTDSDNDNAGDVCDNCPNNYNKNQEDSDGDKVGDVCDNCPNKYNPSQIDSDNDNTGDVCDNCPNNYNKNQEDSDGDKVGDVCDNCPDNYNKAQEDSDNDDVGDVCDNCPTNYNPYQIDSDNDLVGDACEGCSITTFDGRKVCNPVGVHATPCTSGWPAHQGNKVTINEKNYACDLFEVARNDMLAHVEKAFDCCEYYHTHGAIKAGCHGFTDTAYASSSLVWNVNHNNIKKCIALYVIYGLGSGEPPEYMHKYFTNEIRCDDLYSKVKGSDCGECIFPPNKSSPYMCIPGDGPYPDAIGVKCKKYVSDYPDGWKSDTAMSENTCRFSDLPAHVSMNKIQTGTCVDYSTALTTLLRLSGFAPDEVYTATGPGHAFNLIKFPGDNHYLFVDTTGNIMGYNPGGLPQTSYDYTDFHGCEYCEYDTDCLNDNGESNCPGMADILGCPCPLNWIPVDKGGTAVIKEKVKTLEQPEEPDQSAIAKNYGLVVERMVPGRIDFGKAMRVIIKVVNNNTEPINITIHEYIAGGTPNVTVIEPYIPEGMIAIAPPYIEFKAMLGAGEIRTFDYGIMPSLVGSFVHSSSDIYTNKGTFEIPVQKTDVACVSDGVCDSSRRENYVTCPADCPTGSADGTCDGVKDGICDPDCVSWADADCRGIIPSTPPVVPPAVSPVAQITNLSINLGSEDTPVLVNGKPSTSGTLAADIYGSEGKTQKITLTINTETNEVGLEVSGVRATTKEEMRIEESRLYVNDKIVEITPDVAASKAMGTTPISIRRSELKMIGGEPVYAIEGATDARLLGFIPVSMGVSVNVDAESGEIGRVSKPWWSFLAIEE